MIHLTLSLFAFASAGAAAAEPSTGLKGYGYCYARIRGQELVTPLFPWPDKRDVVYEIEGRWDNYLRREWKMTEGNLSDCSMSTTRSQANEFYGKYLRNSGAQVVQFVPLKTASQSTGTSNPPAKSAPTAADPPAADSAEARLAAREKREAEFQAKLAAHEATVAEYQRKVKAREAEIARQQAEHAAAQEKARQAKQAYAEEMTMFERVLEEQRRRQREYEAALALNNRCRDGDQAACAQIRAGGAGDAGNELADAGEAQTSDDEARNCVSRPVVSASTTWKGATQAVVFNGCLKPVDVRICLLRTGGWNCGMTNGLGPQDRWTWWSYESKGEIFWDARITGTNRPLASPGAD